jgi:transcriptional regulator with XRE-family HTH domain
MTLRKARDAKGWTQEDLEAATARAGKKVDQRNISKIERGENLDPSNSTVEALERALDVPRGTLVFVSRTRRGSQHRRDERVSA